MALSRGREMIGKAISSLWPALARMPSEPRLPAGAVQELLGLIRVERVNLFG